MTLCVLLQVMGLMVRTLTSTLNPDQCYAYQEKMNTAECVHTHTLLTHRLYTGLSRGRVFLVECSNTDMKRF